MKPSKLKDAIRAGDLEKIRKLIAGGADVASAFTDGTTPIQLAAREGQVTILRALAAAGADLTDLETLNFQERLKLFVEASLDSEPGDDLMSTGELSAWAMQAVGEQMDDKLAAQIREYEGAVFRAVRTGDLELLKERIAAGDDVNQICSITHDSPLTRALQKGDEEIVLELLAAGADVNHTGFSTPLSFALPDLKFVKLLIDAGADVYGRGLDRQTPLERAVHRALRPRSSEDSPLLVRFFLEAGVDPASSELGEGTMLMEAEYDKAWEIYQELLPHYSEEIAHETFEELKQSQDMKEYDGGFLQWTFDVRYAVRQGDVDELRKLLASSRERRALQGNGACLQGGDRPDAAPGGARPDRSRRSARRRRPARNAPRLDAAGLRRGIVAPPERRSDAPAARRRRRRQPARRLRPHRTDVRGARGLPPRRRAQEGDPVAARSRCRPQPGG